MNRALRQHIQLVSAKPCEGRAGSVRCVQHLSCPNRGKPNYFMIMKTLQAEPHLLVDSDSGIGE